MKVDNVEQIALFVKSQRCLQRKFNKKLQKIWLRDNMKDISHLQHDGAMTSVNSSAGKQKYGTW